MQLSCSLLVPKYTSEYCKYPLLFPRDFFMIAAIPWNHLDAHFCSFNPLDNYLIWGGRYSKLLGLFMAV